MSIYLFFSPRLTLSIPTTYLNSHLSIRMQRLGGCAAFASQHLWLRLFLSLALVWCGYVLLYRPVAPKLYEVASDITIHVNTVI